MPKNGNETKKTEEFKLIEHVSGACYQPSIDDIGDK
jgi:hypothetical protein